MEVYNCDVIRYFLCPFPVIQISKSKKDYPNHHYPTHHNHQRKETEIAKVIETKKREGWAPLEILAE